MGPLTSALSGAPPQNQPKDAPLLFAAVRWNAGLGVAPAGGMELWSLGVYILEREKLSLRQHRLRRKKQSNGLLILLDCANRESVLKPNVLGASPLWRQEGTSLEFQVGCACFGRNRQAVLEHKLRSPGIQRGVLVARRNRVVVQKRVPIE